MKRFVVGFIQRFLVSVAVIILIGGFGIGYGHLFGPSKIAYSASITLIAWPWILPQIFIVVCVVWFVLQQMRRQRHSPVLELLKDCHTAPSSAKDHDT
jgi:hypothetical protein